jgi:hypothetical protein
MLRYVSILLLVLNAGSFGACGDDEDDDHGAVNAGKQAEAGSKAGASAPAGRSGGGRSGSDSAIGGSSGSTSAVGTGSTTVQCGSKTCAADGGGAFGMFAMPCCADESAGTCGMSFMGAACSVPSAGDPRCPVVQAFEGISIPGCCTSAGMCGLDASMFGFGGCTELGAAAQQAGAMGMGMGGMIPPPRRCDDTSDAGTSDAGA